MKNFPPPFRAVAEPLYLAPSWIERMIDVVDDMLIKERLLYVLPLYAADAA